MRDRSGGEILVAALRVNGVERVFCVPGESYIAVLDALYDEPGIAVVACRHEAAAANMAEADGKLSGRPGICFVTRGPGATHAAIGVHTAMQDSTPLILFVGQVARGMRGREAFQEIDYVQMFGGVAKWAAQVDDTARLPEFVARAFRVALSGRPGPVVLALPEDMLRERAAVADLAKATGAAAHPGSDEMLRLEAMLAAAERPLAILGGSGWDAQACAEMRAFAERAELPVSCSFRRQSLFDNRDARYAGDVGLGINPALARRIDDADLIVAVGGRLSEVPSGGYTLIAAPRPRQRFVHVHADPNELGRVFEPDLAINASPRNFTAALGRLAADGTQRAAWRQAAHADYEATLSSSMPGGALDLASLVRGLSDTLPADAILCNGAGNFSTWLHRFFTYKGFGTQLAPTSGAMAYGVPAAIAAKLRFPERVVVAFSGDGDFLMSGHELATALQYDAPIVVVLLDNGMYGTIRMHQERAYPDRPIATTLRNPDFCALARAYGAFAARVERTEQFAPAFEAALASRLPAVLELRVDPDQITPRSRLSAPAG